jgi:hypothetical protein
MLVELKGQGMRGRHFLAVGAVTLTCLIGAPVATADTAAPVAAPSCAGTVEGTPGQPVVLDPASVTEPIARALAALDPLGVLTPAFRGAWANTAPLPIGAIPDHPTEISGGRIADAVIARLGEIPLLGPVLQPLASAVRGTLASVCVLLLRAVRPTPPAQPNPPALVPVTPGAGVGGTPGASTEYTTVGDPGAESPGIGAVFGSRLGDLAPGAALYPMVTIGVPGAPGIPPLAVATTPRSAGSAETLPANSDELSPVVLVALLLLTVVSAQLVRRWVLGPRR